MERLLADTRHALRRLARARGFASIAVLTLALGIGATTAVFSLVRAVMLRPLPYGAPDRLVMIWMHPKPGDVTTVAIPELLSYRAKAPSFEQLAAYTGAEVNLTGGQVPERVVAAPVTRNAFQTLGVTPILGRAFHEDDAAASAVILGYDLWERRFGGDPRIVGRQIQVNGIARTVIGVLPAAFKLPLDLRDPHPAELYLPLDVNGRATAAWGDHSYVAFGRLRAGASAAAADAEMRAAEESWIRDGFRHNRDMVGRNAVPVRDVVLGDFRRAVYVLIGAVLAVLLIACANVANLMLAEADSRHREIGVRVALGAARRNVVQQLLAESALIAGAGAVLGTALAAGGVHLFAALRPADAPLIEQAHIDGGVFAFALLLGMATCLVFGLAPALAASRTDVSRMLGEAGRSVTATGTRQRVRDLLTIAQTAFSVVLLIGASLLVRTLVELRHVNLGFDTRGALTARVSLPQAQYPDTSDVVGFFQRLLPQLRQLPGVRAAGATRVLPLTSSIGDWSITVEGREVVPGENPNGDWQVVTPGYVEAMGIPLEHGRTFTTTDDAAHPFVALVNEAMAKRYWPNQDPIGKRFHLSGPANPLPWITIVGVVGEVHHNAITEAPRTEMYIPHAQFAAAGGSVRRSMTVVLRTAGDPTQVLPGLRGLVHDADPNLPLSDVRTLSDVASAARADARFTSLLLSVFAALALLLASIGVYSVIALLVARRRHDIAVRIALGAQPASVVRMVVRRGLALCGAGVGIGLLGAALLGQTLASMLYGVGRFDPVTFAGVPVVLALVGVAASLVPAVRAARVDPIGALREE